MSVVDAVWPVILTAFAGWRRDLVRPQARGDGGTKEPAASPLHRGHQRRPQTVTEELGYKLSPDTDVPLPGELDLLVARLMVESEKDDEVRRVFLDALNAIAVFASDAAATGDLPEGQLLTERQAVNDKLEELQDTIRDRLK